jgi:hypothetical protein
MINGSTISSIESCFSDICIHMFCYVLCRMYIQEYNYKRDLVSMNIDYRHEYIFLFGGVCKGHETRAATVQ